MKLNTWLRMTLAAVGAIAVAACAGLWGRDAQREAQHALERGDTIQAIRILEPLARSDRAEAEVFIQVGQLYREAHTIIGRLRAEQILREGHEKYPDNTDILFELGRTYYSQTFFSDAERCFERTIELDREYCDAHYYLGLNAFRKWKHIQLYTHHLTDALVHFRHTVRCDASNSDAYFKLTFTLYAFGNWPTASRVCDELIAAHPSLADAHFLRGSIDYRQGRYEESAGALEEALGHLTPDEQENYLDISLLLPEEPREEYFEASKEKRAEIRRAFWIVRDPDPTTELNERYLEHLTRMFFAETYFDHARPPLRGWQTERGKALIKFGWPLAMKTTLQGELPLDGRTEIWTYGAWHLVFRDVFLNGNYMIPTSHEFMAQMLYQDPPRSTFVEQSIAIPGALDAVSFLDGESSSVVYLAFELNVDSLAEHLVLSKVRSYVTRGVFFDEIWSPSHAFTDTLEGDIMDEPNRDGRSWHQLVRRCELPFDRHHVALSLEDEMSVTRVSLQADANTLRYLDPSLTLSDILLYRLPPSAESRSFIHRRGKQFYPNPTRHYLDSEKLRVYVEIYNLQTRGAESEYEVSYAIFEAPENRRGGWAKVKRGIKRMAGFASRPDPIITHTVQRRSSRYHAEEDLAINIGSLHDGGYILNISVLDEISGSIAEQSARFSVGPATHGSR